MTSLKPDKGVLLIAEPSIIGDVSFNRSVVLLAEHNQTGSVGFILNKPLKYCLRDFIPEVNSSLKVYNGGPVEQDNLYFIHKVPDLIPNSTEISSGIYSGWSSDQLDEELKLNSWLVTANEHKNAIIGKPSENFWKEKMIEFGGDYLLWSNAPENPSYN